MNPVGRRRLPDGRSVPIHHNDGLRKICHCPRRVWSRCPHAWHLAFRWKGRSYRFSLTRYADKPITGKIDAQQAADHIRSEIRAGRFGKPPDPPANQPQPSITFETFGQLFVERFSKAREKTSWDDDAAMIKKIMAFPATVPGEGTLGQKPLDTVLEDDLEAFVRHIASSRTISTRNHYVQLIRTMSNWAVKKGYRATPFATGDSGVIRRRKARRRNRRLEPGEEEALLAAAPPLAKRLIIAALETACRQGELLSLQWRDVSLGRGEIILRAEKTKTSTDRVIPISERLRAMLEMNRTDPSDEEFGPLAYVFGDELGHQVKGLKQAWQTLVLKAHGHTPTWAWSKGKTKKGTGTLSAASRAEYRAINLHFHDLRHEAGSRLLEAGWPLHEVQQMLGHASLEQTSTYLNATLRGMHRSMRAFDRSRAIAESAEPQQIPEKQGESGIPCKIVARNPACNPLAPCNTSEPSEDKSLIH
jgi:integrase